MSRTKLSTFTPDYHRIQDALQELQDDGVPPPYVMAISPNIVVRNIDSNSIVTGSFTIETDFGPIAVELDPFLPPNTIQIRQGKRDEK